MLRSRLLYACVLAVVFMLLLGADAKKGKAKQPKRHRKPKGKSIQPYRPNDRIIPIPQDEFATNIHWDQDPWLPVDSLTDNVQRLSVPSLTQPFYNQVLDVHATMDASSTNFILSTNGNWMSALYNLLDNHFFPSNPLARASYLITTSPPISVSQMATGVVKVGNVVYTNAYPHVVVAPGKVITKLVTEGYVNSESDDSFAFISTYANVILKRKGDTRIMSFWDLQNIKEGRFASSDPSEGGSFNNYKGSVYNIAIGNPKQGSTDAQIEADAALLESTLFGADGTKAVTIGSPMHRSIPHSIATGNADCGLFFLHLAVYVMRENPGMFEAVFLGTPVSGTSMVTDDPEVLCVGQAPLDGNKVGTFKAARTVAPNTGDGESVDRFLATIKTTNFTNILVEAGLRRPDGWTDVNEG